MRSRKLNNYVFEPNYILKGYRGSIAHNVHVPREADDVFGVDDIDYFGIFSFPYEYYLGLNGYYHTREVVDQKIEQDDTVEYELHKAFHLLSACNPNILGFLFNKPEHYTNVSEGGKLLLEKRDIFFSRRQIRDAYAGYAHAQLTKLTHGAYKGYMGERRKKVVDEYGYDTKNASTLLRLLAQGIEALKTNEIQTYRTDDRDFLLGVKTGKYSLDEIHNFADDKFKELDSVYEESKMQLDNNRTHIEELCVEILEIETKLPTRHLTGRHQEN